MSEDPWATPAFLSPLRAEYIGNDQWVIWEALIYDSAEIRQRVIVPKGTCLDFSSSPRWLPVSYALTGNVAHPAAALHDWAYGSHIMSKADADTVFREAMAVLGEPAWRRTAMYWAVHWFGGSAYATGPARFRSLNNDTMPPPLPGDGA